MASHVGGPHVSAERRRGSAIGRQVAPRRPRPPTGLAALSPETGERRAAQPSDLDDDEGSAILHAQVLLDRARFSSGVLNGKAGQNM